MYTKRASLNREEALKFLIEWEEKLHAEFKKDSSFAAEKVSYYDFKNLMWILTLILKEKMTNNSDSVDVYNRTLKIRHVLIKKRDKISEEINQLIKFTTEEPTTESVTSFTCKLSNIALINTLLVEISNEVSCSN